MGRHPGILQLLVDTAVVGEVGRVWQMVGTGSVPG